MWQTRMQHLAEGALAPHIWGICIESIKYHIINKVLTRNRVYPKITCDIKFKKIENNISKTNTMNYELEANMIVNHLFFFLQ